MNDYLLICRSITYEQRALRAIQRAGITAQMYRIPAGLTRTGCGYAVRVRGQDLPHAVYAMRLENMQPVSVFVRDGSSYREVPYDLS